MGQIHIKLHWIYLTIQGQLKVFTEPNSKMKQQIELMKITELTFNTNNIY